MRRLSDYLKSQFGEKIYKLSMTSGCTCPNRDGTAGVGGCTFCSETGSGEFASDFASVREQIEEAKKKINQKTDARKFIAYYQSYTNTYGDVERLEKFYTETIQQPEIVVLSIGTRPDCLPEEIMAMLIRLNAIKPVWVELGLQTIHEKTAVRINRGYRLEVFTDAYRRLKEAGIEVIVHVILGLPGESREDMVSTIKFLSELSPELDGIKLHMLQILKGTKLCEEYLEKPFPVMSLDEYASLIADLLQILPEKCVLHRMTGDGPRNLIVEPEWSLHKKNVLNTINKRIAQRNHSLPLQQ